MIKYYYILLRGVILRSIFYLLLADVNVGKSTKPKLCQISGDFDIWKKCNVMYCFRGLTPCSLVDQSPGPYRWTQVVDHFLLTLDAHIQKG